MRSDPPKWETEIVLLNRLTGMHGRMTGNFRDAQVADQESAHAHEMEFGHDHPHVFPALNSVITNLVLNGESAAVGALANALARTGGLDAARTRAQEAIEGFQRRFGVNHPYTLASEANIATIQSRMGHEPASAEFRERYTATLGLAIRI
jgi:hypothetical protein